MTELKRWQKAQKAESGHETHKQGFRSRETAETYFEDYWNSNIETIKNETVLSIGAGTGIIHCLDAPAVQIGVDPIYASTSIPVEKSNAECITGAGEELPFPNESFDTVISSNVLDHTQNPKRCLNEIRRVLKKDGQLLFGINTFEINATVRKRLDVVDTPHPHHFNISEIRSLFEGTGFQIDYFQSDPLFRNKNLINIFKEQGLKSGIKRIGARVAGIHWSTAVCTPDKTL